MIAQACHLLCAFAPSCLILFCSCMLPILDDSLRWWRSRRIISHKTVFSHKTRLPHKTRLSHKATFSHKTILSHKTRLSHCIVLCCVSVLFLCRFSVWIKHCSSVVVSCANSFVFLCSLDTWLSLPCFVHVSVRLYLFWCVLLCF